MESSPFHPVKLIMRGKMVFSLKWDPKKIILPLIISLTGSSPFPLKCRGSFSTHSHIGDLSSQPNHYNDCHSSRFLNPKMLQQFPTNPSNKRSMLDRKHQAVEICIYSERNNHIFFPLTKIISSTCWYIKQNYSKRDV